VIVADHIFGTQLDVLATNTGSLYVDEWITLNAAGHIKGGMTDYLDGNGFWIGYTGGEYKFSIGDSASNSYLAWDGTDLTVKGDLHVGEYIASDNIILSATTERSAAGGPGPSPNYFTKKTFTVDKAGDVKVVFEWKHGAFTGGVGDACYWRITLNSVDETEWGSSTQTSYTTNTTTITGVSAGDVIDVDVSGGERDPFGEPTPVAAYVRNVYIKADVVINPGGSVDLD